MNADDICMVVFKKAPGMAAHVRPTLDRLCQHDVSGGVVVDIGANLGAVSIMAALNGASEVVAYEPDTTLAGIMDANISHFGLSDRVRVVRKAVAVSGGQAAEWRGLEYVCGQRGLAYGDPVPVLGTVDTVGFCDVIEGHDRIAYLKIDIEGGEYSFLKSDQRTLAALRRAAVVDIELHDARPPFTAWTPEMRAESEAALMALGVAVRDGIAHGIPQ